MSNKLMSWQTLSTLENIACFLPEYQMKPPIKNCVGYYLGHYVMEYYYDKEYLLLWEKCTYCGNTGLSETGMCSTCGAPPGTD